MIANYVFLALQWTNSGDAFIIGSDIKRLESETLPTFFRHGRFQSLVRQLNFYSFRKVNRERHIWVYKHDLFHRDRPDDLNLVRRRTCPGLDGRRQRSLRSPSKVTETDSPSEDELSTESPADVASISENSRKRSNNHATRDVAKIKRVRIVTNEPYETNVDLSVFESSTHTPVPVTDDKIKKPSQSDLAERSLVVSEVAKKLDEHARKLGIRSKGRRVSGIITPPYGATSLFTYDDEIIGNKPNHSITHLDKSSSGLGVVSDGDDSLSSEDDILAPSTFFTPNKMKEIPSAPVVAEEAAKRMAECLVQQQPVESRNDLVGPSMVLQFCLSNSPYCDNKELGAKIIALINQCGILARDFQLYCSALHPSNQPRGELLEGSVDHHIRDDEEKETTSISACGIRDFKTFALNYIQGISAYIDCASISSFLSVTDKQVLDQMSTAWANSVGLMG